MKDRSLEQSNIDIISLDLGSFVSGELPAQIIDVARQALDERIRERQLRGRLVFGFGRDLHIHVSTYNGDFPPSNSLSEDPLTAAAQAALAAGLEALKEAQKMGLGSPEAEAIPSLPPPEQAAALNLRRLNFAYTERGAEPIFVAKTINGSWGFFNRALFNLFFNPDKGSGRRIEGNDFLGVVESIEDLKNNKPHVRTFEFGPGYVNEMIALIADAEEWRLSRVYAVRGKFGEGKLSDEPAAAVEGSVDPVLIGRSQSGLPAIGEFTQSVGEFFFAPGGDGGHYRVGLMPTDFQEARTITSLPGAARVVSYAYQSYDNGRIPAEEDVVDVFAQNRAETSRVQRDAARLVMWLILTERSHRWHSIGIATATGRWRWAPTSC